MLRDIVDSFGFRIAVTVLFIGLTPLFLTTYVSLNQTQDALRDQSVERLNTEIESVSENAETRSLLYKKQVRMVERQESVRSLIRYRYSNTSLRGRNASYPRLLDSRPEYNETQEFFEDVGEDNPNIDMIRVFWKDGNVLTGYKLGEEDTQDYKGDKIWFEKVMDPDEVGDNEVYVSSINIARATDSPAIRYATPVEVNGERVGLVIINYQAKQITQPITKLGIRDTGYAALVDLDYTNAEGESLGPMYVANGRNPNLSFNTSVDEYRIIGSDRFEEKNGSFTYSRGSEEWFAEYQQVDLPSGGDYYAVATVPTSEIFAPAIRIRDAVEMIAVVSAAVVIVAGLYISRRMTEPIREFAEDAKKIADGDLDHSIKVSYPTSEMRLMSESACEMKQRLLRALDEAEEAKEEAENARTRYESIFEGSPDAVVLADVETGEILEVNRQASDIFGYSEDELRKMRQPDLHPEDKREEYAEAFESVRDRVERSPVTITEREDGSPICIETKSGESKPVSIRSTNIEVDGRKFAYATFRDISARKKRQRRLEMFRKAVEHAGHAIYITDTDGVIEYVNSEFEEITGYSAEEMIGETPRKLKSGEQDEEYYEKLWETILAGDVWEEEVVDRRKDGRLYTAHQTIAPITDSGGDPTKFVAIQTDISSRMLRQQRLQVMHRVLRHNLRNGLSVIIGYSEMIDDESQSRGIGEMIRKKASELESLSEKAERVNSLLEVSDDSDSKSGLDEVLTDIAQKMSLRYEDAEVEWDSELSEEYTVSMRTKTAIKEIVDNAVEHNDTRDPRVKIDVVECDDEIEVDVSDNGPGIPDEEKEVLRNGEETHLKHGSGLGLWLVYWLVKMEGGKIEIAERQPRGSTVRVILPKPD